SVVMACPEHRVPVEEHRGAGWVIHVAGKLQRLGEAIPRFVFGCDDRRISRAAIDLGERRRCSEQRERDEQTTHVKALPWRDHKVKARAIWRTRKVVFYRG